MRVITWGNRPAHLAAVGRPVKSMQNQPGFKAFRKVAPFCFLYLGVNFQLCGSGGHRRKAGSSTEAGPGV